MRRSGAGAAESIVSGLFVHSDHFAGVSLGENHPFKPVRARAILEMCRREGLLGDGDAAMVEPASLPAGALEPVHDADYVDALQRANEAFHEDLLRFNLGRAECPVFPGVFDYAAGAVAATLTGVEALLAGTASVAFNPVGGMHHAMPGNAEGFCYLNDAAVALGRLVAAGRRPLYLDIDAHHGNGVQQVFYERGDVMVVSVHESGRTLYPWSGFETESGEGPGAGHTINFPLPQDTDDELYNAVMDAVVWPVIESWRPDCVVVVMGMDTLAKDPLTHLKLTNNAPERALRKLASLDVPVLALGGGGYDLDATVRGWTLGWAALNRLDLAEADPGMGGRFLGSAELGGASLRDPAVLVSGETRARNVQECIRVEKHLKRKVFPLLGV